jgi:hypothetical protein
VGTPVYAPLKHPAFGFLSLIQGFEAYLVHSLSSPPKTDVISTASLSFSGSMSPSRSINSTYSGTKSFFQRFNFLQQFID